MGTRAGGPPAVLIIDEAGQFSDAQLSDLHRLVAPGHPLAEFLQIVLAALPSFEDRLKQSQLAPLQQAIVHRARLQPLRADELAGYIAHRCRVAGLADSALSEAAAIRRIYELTRGTPRLVNRLCSAALFVARSSGSDSVSVAILDEAALGCNLSDTPAAAKPTAPPAAPPVPSTTPPAAPAHPRAPAAPLAPEAIVLAEAERAWVKAVLPPIAEASPAPPLPRQQARPDAPPPAVLELTEPAPPVLELSEPAPPVLELSEPAPPVLELTESLDERVVNLAARRRIPSLRIAASIALVATSGVALAALYWPSADRKDAAVAEAPAADTKTVAAAPPAAAPASVGSATPEPIAPAREAEVAAATPAPPAAEPSAVATTATDNVVAAAPPLAVEAPASTPNAAPPAPAAAMAEAPAAPPPAESAPAPAAVSAQLAQAPEAVKEEPPAEPAAAPTAKVEEPAAPSMPQPQVATNVDPPIQQPEDAAAVEPAAGKDPQAAQSVTAAASDEPSRADTAAANSPLAPEIAEPTQSAASAAAMPPPPAQPVSPSPQIAAVSPVEPVLRLAQTAVAPRAEGATPTELAQLMTRGDEMMRIGDPASAKLFYERAAATRHGEGNSPPSAAPMILCVLQQLNIRGGGANGERALEWYRRGAEAGDADAGKVAGDLTAWLARQR